LGPVLALARASLELAIAQFKQFAEREKLVNVAVAAMVFLCALPRLGRRPGQLQPVAACMELLPKSARL
jgi:hypothetical protein